MAATVKTRVLIISDTHGAPLENLPKADLLIHCGDLSMTGGYTQYQDALHMISQVDAPVKLVIAGNHDYTLDQAYVSTHPEDTTQAAYDKARTLWSQAKHDGITFLDEGTHEIRLANEASVRIYASPYTPEFMDWGFAYERNEDRFNPPAASLEDAQNIASNPVPSLDSTGPIDLLVTHGPPFAILDKTFSNENVGCPHLLRAVMRSRPLLHVFGHIHEGHGVERIQWYVGTSQFRSCINTKLLTSIIGSPIQIGLLQAQAPHRPGRRVLTLQV